ncbi:MAG: TlpA family protein disulfide reductase [Ardenticatenales bacterium]|nr:TlpA family protein disulfide reductase [Ardenticatenales bacterium]
MRLPLLFLLLLLLTACGDAVEIQSPSVATIDPVVGEGIVQVDAPAPTFRLPTTSGGVVELESLRGKVVIVNFWATWCGPCRVEMPELQAVYEAHRDAGLEIIAVEAQSSGSAEESTTFLQEAGVTFPSVRDEEGLMELHYIRRPAWPTTVIIDQEGIVRFVQLGATTREMIEAQLDELGL